MTCPVHGAACRPVPWKVGEKAAQTGGLFVLAEGPGEEEVAQGAPLVGSTGRFVERMLQRVKDPLTGRGLVLSDFSKGNVVNCKSEGLFLGEDPNAPALVDYWRPIVRQRLEELKPSVVLAMGAFASEFFLGDIFDEVKEWRGYVEPFDWGWPFHVVFTYHPSFLMRGNFSLSEVWQYDFLRALKVSREGWHPEPVHYVLNPTPLEAESFFREWCEGGRPPLAFDIETPYSDNEEELAEDDLLEDVPDASWEVLRISFAFKEKEAITFPWQPPFIDMALDALGEAPFSTVWNAPFDCPRLERQAALRGKTIFNGYVCDAMDAHKFLKPHLPRRLKFVATLWTDLSQWAAHRGKGEEVYSCTDSDALLRVFNKVQASLQRSGRWDLFHRHYTMVMRVLRKMSRRGILVDRPAMEDAFGRLSKRLDGEVALLQDHYPLHLKKEVEWKGSEKRLPELPGWYRKEVPLTEKELSRLAAREAKEKEKTEKRAARAAERLAKRAAKEAAKAARPRRGKKCATE